MNKVLILYGSSSPAGNTKKSVDILMEDMNGESIDVAGSGMTPYDYNAKNAQDEFYRISLKMIEADIIVFATPVYWYAMSAQMKIFFDRLSDLITIRKRDGRALAGKKTFLIANGTDTALPDGFEVPFMRTSDYFNMEYGGACYVYTGKNEDLSLKSWDGLLEFRQKILSRKGTMALSKVAK